VDEIVSELEKDGFCVVARGKRSLTQAFASKITADTSVYPSLAAGESIGLVVEGLDAAIRLRLRVGPAVTVAKSSVPSLLRAMFGTDDYRVGVVAADSVLSAKSAMEIYFVQPLPLQRCLAVIKPGIVQMNALCHRCVVLGYGGVQFMHACKLA
jgi:nucleoside diphosphate kinase